MTTTDDKQDVGKWVKLMMDVCHNTFVIMCRPISVYCYLHC